MADNPQTLAAILNALPQRFPDLVRRQVNRRSVTLSLFRVNVGQGKNVPLDIELDGAVAENFAEGAAVANFGNDALSPATLGWGLYRANFRITNLAAAAAMAGASPSTLRDLVGRGFENASMKLASFLNGDAFAGTGSGTTLAGLSGAILKDNNTYAGIDRTNIANALWRAYVVDPGVLTPISFKLIRQDLAAIYKASGVRPDAAGVSPDVMVQLKGLFDANRRFEKGIETVYRGKVILQNNSDVVEIDGCQFFEDKDATVNEIDYINTGEIDVEVLQQAVNFADPFAPATDGFNQLMLGFSIYELGRVGSDRRFSMEAQVQLKCERPNTCGKRLNVATP